MKKLKFNCGCEFSTEGGRIIFNPDIEKLPIDCEKTWGLISEGNTKGCFQLESRLGQATAKQVGPNNIEELSALIAIIRPGCKEAMVGGKSLTDHYIDRKHGRESVDYFHPKLEPILKNTYGILVYQEQSMKIAQVVAGFDLQEADILRKAIGKKKADVMAQVKKSFLSKAKTNGVVTKEQAEEIFSWIEKSQRYSFNKSHSISYAINAYLSAYTKAHFTREFFASYLFYSKEKQKPHEEINELVNNAKLMDIDVCPPDIRKMNKNFSIFEDVVYFGLSDIKGVGGSVIDKIKSVSNDVRLEIGKDVCDWSWMESLSLFLDNINSTAVKAIISVGCFSYLSSNRTKMLYEYEIYNKLTIKEKKWVTNKIKESPAITMQEILEALTNSPVGKKGGVANKKRLITVNGILESMKTPPYKLEDTAEWISGVEEDLLGIPITCTKVDSCSTENANCSCKDFLKQSYSQNKYLMLAVQIDDIREITIKNGKNRGSKMAFIAVSDSSCALDAVIFSDRWVKYKPVLFEGNTVMLHGNRDRDRNSLIVEKVWQI